MADSVGFWANPNLHHYAVIWAVEDVGVESDLGYSGVADLGLQWEVAAQPQTDCEASCPLLREIPTKIVH